MDMSHANPPRPWISRRLAAAILTWTAVAVLVAAAGYEALQAFGVLEIGPEPGQTPTGETAVLEIALITLAAGGLALLLCAANRRVSALIPLHALQSLSVAAAAFATARWSSYDPYYAPTLRRMSEGIIGPGWIIALVALAAIAVWGATRSRRAGTALTGAVLWLAAFVALFCAGGH